MMAWATLGLAMWAGFERTRIWLVLALATAVTAFHLAFVLKWWIDLGLDRIPERAGRQLAIYLAIAAIGYGLGRLAARIIRRR